MRDYTVVGYYTTKIGLESIGYPGLRTVWPNDARLRASRRSRTRYIFARAGRVLPPTSRKAREELHWLTKVYDAIVVGTGAGGGTAMKILCEAGLRVCAINSGPRTNPARQTIAAIVRSTT